MRHLNEVWTADVVGRLHRLNITQSEFAYFCGITPQYLSCLLNGKKKFESEYSKEVTKKG
jgi:transcriptional regulator with XRE-family HTH domain